MKKNKLRTFYLAVFILMFIAICGYHYFYKLHMISKPPSDRWSKDVTISSGNITTDLAIEKLEENYIVAHNDGNKLKFITVDKTGKKFNEKTFEYKSELIRDLDILKSSDFIYFTFVTNDFQDKKLHIFKLDKELNIVSQEELEGVKASTKLDDTVLALGFEDKIDILDMNSNKVIGTLQENEPNDFESISNERGQLFVYKTGDGDYKYVFYNKEDITQPQFICKLQESVGVRFENTVVSADENNLYLFAEQMLKSAYDSTLYYKYSFDQEKVIDDGVLSVNNNKYIRNLAAVNNGNEIRFLGTSGQVYGLKTYKQNLIDFTFNQQGKNEEIKDTDVFGIEYDFIYPIDDMVFFAEYDSLEDYKINMASQSEEFKRLYNDEITSNEKKIAALLVSEGVLQGFSYIFFLSLSVMFVGLFLGVLFTFLQRKFNTKTRTVLFIALCIAVIISKIFVIKMTFYERYFYYMPQHVSSLFVGILINIIISTIIYSYCFILYKKNEHEMEFGKFMGLVTIDGFLTLLIFTPFII